ncbi:MULTISPECIES: hypothetical protein [Streptomyces]|uniref:DUF3224 domain-containing protein n=1 Tax=Streptomyces venezuelae (strain ATCC 10712 / CBS 650.69 / DSM 40230 / JCM 4526 / NBRC 13096 / PD 04745) TaxID=953739 RepID=F2R1A6_STRVP|nr:hypothetical protein [Streptomyces venezuelae]APE23658.1 hypothetical protein vnz_23285 [Streptomyces venezuelae]QES01031.1 hypothetical protein DEJ43_23615 [Streptomyces venezuelae ATCC 10712]CCA57997.1 hypothetical protein SVEN_4711 [Streptomyces venezuelae ATCC 10712]
MFRSFRRIGALGVSAVAAGAFCAVAAVPASAADGFEFTVYAKEVPGDQSGEATGPPPELGDSFAFADDLFRTKGGDRIGRDGVACTVVRAGNPSDVLCVGTFVFDGGPGGQVTGQTMLTVDPGQDEVSAFDIAVNGGTGDFKDARGTIRSTPDGDYSRLEFHIGK